MYTTKYHFVFLLWLSAFCAFAQVGIGTANVAPGAILQLESTTAAFVMPRLTDASMSLLTAAPEGAMVFNDSESLPYFKGSAGWSGFNLSSNPTLILSRNSGTFATSATTSYPMPLSSSHVLAGSSAYFSVLSDGRVKVTRGGVYLFAASLSTTNMPAGNRNYYLALYKNGVIVGYFSRSRLENPSTDYWGTTGTIMSTAESGDEFMFRYYINHTSALNTAFQSICITKLN